MHPRASELVQRLGLIAHPEGGSYCEVFRSRQTVRPADERPERSAMTVIYFLLVEGERSAWHRVASDETWTWLEGDPLELLDASQPGEPALHVTLAPVDAERAPVHVIPAGRWQAARSTGAYTLVSCVVAPGFDFVDFEMLGSAELL
jgi:uncharacterized protein